jgi:hypothetical protein
MMSLEQPSQPRRILHRDTPRFGAKFQNSRTPKSLQSSGKPASYSSTHGRYLRVLHLEIDFPLFRRKTPAVTFKTRLNASSNHER